MVAGVEGLDPSANPGIIAVDFLPHLIPMTRGILSASHVRPTRPIICPAFTGPTFVSTDERLEYQTVTPGETSRITILPKAGCQASLMTRASWTAYTGVPHGALKSSPVWRRCQWPPRSPNRAVIV